MGESKLLRVSPRACAIWIVVGFVLFLIGAQLPYEHRCIADFPCISRTLIDVTGDGHSSNDPWHVSMWLARLTPVLLAAVLIHRRSANATRAAGFVAFVGIMLAAFYFPNALPFMLAGMWEPGAALWPLGAILMTVAAILARGRLVPDPEQVPAPARSWVVLIVVGITLSGVGVWSDSEAAAYLFALGMTILVAGLLLMRGRVTGRPAHARWAIVPLVLGSVLVAASYFAPWSRGEHPYLLIRTEFMFDLRRADFWEIIVLLSLISGAVVASIDLLRKGVANGFVGGGALAGPYFLLASLLPALGDEGFSRAAPAVQLAIIGIALVLIGVLYIILRGAPARPSEAATGESGQPALQPPLSHHSTP